MDDYLFTSSARGLNEDKQFCTVGITKERWANTQPIDAVPCVQLSPMSAAQKKAYVLADNKLALNAGWDEELMDGEAARMVFTDPPYNVPIDGHVCGSGSIKHREFAMASGEMSKSQFRSFLDRAFEQLVAHKRSERLE